MFKSFFHYKPSNLGYPHLLYPHGGFLVPTCEDKNMERGEVLRFACGLEGMIPISMFLFGIILKIQDSRLPARSHQGFLFITVASFQESCDHHG